MICNNPVRSSSSIPSIWYRLPIRGIPFTRVCSEPCALKNCECSNVAGVDPGTRFSSDWKFLIRTHRQILQLLRLQLRTDIRSVCLQQRGRRRHHHLFRDAARRNSKVHARRRIDQEVDVLMGLLLNPCAATVMEYVPGGEGWEW